MAGDKLDQKLLDEVMDSFTKGVDKARKAHRKGAVEGLHDMMDVDPKKADDHMKPLPLPKKP